MTVQLRGLRCVIDLEVMDVDHTQIATSLMLIVWPAYHTVHTRDHYHTRILAIAI